MDGLARCELRAASIQRRHTSNHADAEQTLNPRMAHHTSRHRSDQGDEGRPTHRHDAAQTDGGYAEVKTHAPNAINRIRGEKEGHRDRCRCRCHLISGVEVKVLA